MFSQSSCISQECVGEDEAWIGSVLNHDKFGIPTLTNSLSAHFMNLYCALLTQIQRKSFSILIKYQIITAQSALLQCQQSSTQNQQKFDKQNPSYLSMNNQYDSLVKKLMLISIAGAATKKWKKLALRSKDRFYRLRQLVETERDYYKDLSCIKNKIKQPLIDCKAITAAQANSSLFPNIDSMMNLSLELQKDLSEKLQQFDRRTTLIGSTMIKFSKFLLVYQQFFKNIKDSQRKLQALLKNNEKARLIQKQLSVGKQIITFQNLMSKPFQRPLKYHLILKDYASKLDETHPDYFHLKNAINCYHKVNIQNNLAMENKQKDINLMQLDMRFGGIIDTVSRCFVAQYQAVCIDCPINLFIFSDLLILSHKDGHKQAEFMRLYFDKYSHVQSAPDGHYFINRMFFYGKRLCIHLTFATKQIRNQVYAHLNSLIEETSNNEINRSEIILQRNTRNSIPERRRSFTHLQPQFQRPMLISVLGNETRMLGKGKEFSYFVIEFHPTPTRINAATTPHQLSLVQLDTILKIEQFCHRLYPEVTLQSILFKPKNLSTYHCKMDEHKRLQFQNIFLQLQLNTIFRNQQILKRVDLIATFLKMSDALWLHLKVEVLCQCKGCCSKQLYINTDEYFLEKKKRYMIKTKQTGILKQKIAGVQYCDLRTIHSQQMLASFHAPALTTGEQRLIWVKSQLGWINHSFTFQKCSFSKINCIIHFCNLSEDSIEVDFYPNQRVKQIVDYIGHRLGCHMQDYTLAAHINGTVVMLNEDQLLGCVVLPPKKQKTSLNSFIGLFKHEDYYKIQIYLRKKWVLQASFEKCSDIRKINLQVQEIIYRLRNEELKLIDHQLQQIYALYYAYKHFIELNMLTLSKMKLKIEQIYKIIPYKVRNPDFVQKMYFHVQIIKKNPSTDILTIALSIIEKINDRPGWSCFMFEGFLKDTSKVNERVPVKIGCDLKGIKIKERLGSGLISQFNLSTKNWSCHMNNLDLVIEQQKIYTVTGRDLWKVKQQVDFCKMYYSAFIKQEQ